MKKSKRIIAAVLTLLMLVSMQAGPVQAAQIERTKPEIMLAEMLSAMEVNPGDTFEMKIPVKASKYYAKNPIVSSDLGNTPFELVSEFVLSRDDTTAVVTNINLANTTFITFSLRVKETARKGDYTIPLNFVTVDNFGDFCSVDLITATPIKVRVKSEKALPNLKLTDKITPDKVKPEDKFDVVVTYENVGELTASDVIVTLEDFEAAGLIPNFIDDAIQLPDLKKGESATAKFSLSAIKEITAGVKKIKAKVSYKTKGGVTASSDSAVTVAEADVFLHLEGAPEKPVVEPKDCAVILTKAVLPERIKAEDELTIKVTYQNKGKTNAEKVTVDIGTDYDTASFLPTFLYAAQKLGTLKPGESKTITYKFDVAKAAAAGVKSFNLKMTYQDKDSNGDTVKYESINPVRTEILSTQVEEPKITNSIPKLLIKKYDVGTDKLMAGSQFMFTFDVLNSHSSVSANNIKVTVSSDGTFSIVEGSASFLIPTIAPGQIEQASIPLKVKPDAATQGFDLKIKFEYEYPGLDKDGNSTSATSEIEEVIKLPVYANARPELSNISLGYYEPPITGELTTLNFDFANKGKSPLYNVTVYCEGTDFQPMNDNLFIGQVDAGASKTWQMDVTPVAEGFGTGNLRATYEDSDGNVSEFTMPFESSINSAVTGGGVEPEPGGDIDVDGGGLLETKKELVPLWAFICIQAGIFVISVPIARTLVIKRYKKKHKDDEY